MMKKWHENSRLQESLKKNDFNLLKFHQTEEWKALEVFGHHKNIMLTVTMALIAGGCTAVSGDRSTLILLGCIIPTLVVIIRHFMIRFLDRYYARFLESVIVQRKLRFVIGASSESDWPFSDDKHLVVPRLCGESALPAESTSWVRKKLEEGHNKVLSQFLTALFLLSLLLPLVASFRLAFEESLGPETHKLLIAGICLILSLLVAVVSYFRSGKAIRKNRDEEYGRA